jgi:hypothetical protein
LCAPVRFAPPGSIREVLANGAPGGYVKGSESAPRERRLAVPQFTRSRLVALAALALVTAATAQAAQPPKSDPIDLARARQKVADQKAEAEVSDAIAAADRFAKSNPAKAAQLLKAAQSNIDLSAAVSGEARRTLTNALQAKLAAVEGRPLPPPGPGAKLDPKAADVKAAEMAKAEKYLADLKDVREGIAAVSKANDANDTARANAEIARLQRMYPNNPSVIVLGQTDSMKSRLADALAFQKLQDDRMWALQKNLAKSALPAVNDIEFPANWKEISARRLKGVELTAKEKKIVESLDKLMSVNFADRPLEEALQDLGLDLKKGTTLQAKGISGRSVLRSVLGAHGLTFVVRDEVIQVVTVEKSRTLMATKAYYVGDLIRGTGTFGDFRFGPVANLQQTQANAAALIDAIKKIDPLSWSGEGGGGGTVIFDFASLSIVVRNSAEVHHALGRSFGGGR